MVKKTVLDTCPPLPAGPVDFDQLEAAIAAGKNAEQVVRIVQGLPENEEAKLAPASATPAPAPADEPIVDAGE